jgi:hypothetical protein
MAYEFGTCVCGGTFEPREVTVTFQARAPSLVPQQADSVPQAACNRCGLRVYKNETLTRIEAAFRGATETRVSKR